MKQWTKYTLALGLTLIVAALTVLIVLAAEIVWYGGAVPAGLWPSDIQWMPVAGMEVDSAGELNQHPDLPTPVPVAGRVDFIGNADNPQMYYHSNANYLFFRMRVNDDVILADEYNDTLFVIVDTDADDAGFDVPYAFGWDTRGAPPASPPETDHGLEMLVVDGDFQDGTLPVTNWYDLIFDDVDGQEGAKVTPYDFDLAAGDGYLRTVDGIVPVGVFPTTSFVDIAISWDFLANTAIYEDGINDEDIPLDKNQCWDIQVASIELENDHNNIMADVGGDQTVLTPVTTSQGDGANPFLSISADDYPGEICFGPNAVTAVGLSSRNSSIIVTLATMGIVLTSLSFIFRRK